MGFTFSFETAASLAKDNYGQNPTQENLLAAQVFGAMANVGKYPQASKREAKASREGAAFVWDCVEWDERRKNGEDEPPIVSIINPESMSWSIPVRVTKTNVYGGTVFHRWKNLRGDSTDLYRVKFKMNTGNIMTISSPSDGGGNTFFSPGSNSQKVRALARFMQLFHTPAFTTTKKEPNIMSLVFSTPLFSNVTLYFLFTDPLNFSEDAKNPFNVTYDVDITVLDMLPRLGSSSAMGQLLGVGSG